MNAVIVDIKRFAVHDGPGIRTTLFLKGCPLKCLWCHNPESISSKPEIGYLKNKCIVCRKCELVCQSGAHKFQDESHFFDRSKCTACGKCVEVCQPEALEYYGRKITVDAAVKEIMKDCSFYTNSGGGATLSGGEPLSQAKFCAELFKRLRESGIHCAIDTSGAVRWEAFETVLPYTDMFLYDLKHTDEKLHIEYTGQSNSLTINNLYRLSECDIPIEIRIPLIPGFNADNASIDTFGKLLSTLSNITAVKILPYHDFAKSKYEAIGENNNLQNVPVPTPEQIQVAKKRLKEFNLNVK